MEGLAIFGGIIVAGILVFLACSMLAMVQLKAERWWRERQLKKREFEKWWDARRN